MQAQVYPFGSRPCNGARVMADGSTPATGLELAFTRWPSLTATRGERCLLDGDAFVRALRAPKVCAKAKLPGFSFALFTDDTRSNAGVECATALALDYDAGTVPVADAVAFWSRYRGALYTTPSHTVECPRFRVVLFFAVPVDVDVFRRAWAHCADLARTAGHTLDGATKDPARLWFVPGVLRKGAPYEVHALDGAVFDPRELPAPAPVRTPAARKAAPVTVPPEVAAAAYVNAAIRKAVAAVQSAPEGQRNAVLNREAYGLAGLPDLDEDTVRELLGTAAVAAGLTAAEAARTIQSAWATGAQRPRAIPERTAPPVRERAPRVPPPEPPRDGPEARGGSDWTQGLPRTPNGGIANTYASLAACLRGAPEFCGLAFNDMTLTPELNGCALADEQLGLWRERLELAHGLRPSVENLMMALRTVACARRYHPVQRYLEALPPWDGVPRLDWIAADILHVDPVRPEAPIAARMVRAWMVQAVARAMEPGCRADALLVLVSKAQGLKKSTFFQVLGGPFFGDTRMNIDNKDSLMQLHATWIYEWSEVEHITSPRQVGTIKAFVSSRTDCFRPPYERTVRTVPRAVVLCGTTNESQFLQDDTGDRRFFVVEIFEPADSDALAAQRDQLWAEARDAYRRGESWHLSAELEAARDRATEAFREADPWVPLLLAWLALNVTGELVHGVMSHELLNGALGVERKDMDRRAEMRVARILRRQGWTHAKVRVTRQLQEIGPRWVWVPPPDAVPS